MADDPRAYWDERAAAFAEEPAHGCATRPSAPPRRCWAPGCRREAVVERLEDPVLWRREIDDERYMVVSER
jgi:hypothetical protein